MIVEPINIAIAVIIFIGLFIIYLLQKSSLKICKELIDDKDELIEEYKRLLNDIKEGIKDESV